MPVARTALTDTSTTEAVAAPGATARIKVTGMIGSNAGASLSTATLKDGTTAKFSLAMAANGGGFGIVLPPGGWLLTANTALNVVQSASVTSYVTVCYEIVGATG
jgi:hypothetical protein